MKPTQPDWKNEIIGSYSKLALIDEDCVDGYQMVPAVDFIESLLLSQQAQYRAELVEKAEKMKMREVPVSMFTSDAPIAHRAYNQAIKDILALLQQ